MYQYDTIPLQSSGCPTRHTSNLTHRHLQSNKSRWRSGSSFLHRTIPEWNSLLLNIPQYLLDSVFWIWLVTLEHFQDISTPVFMTSQVGWSNICIYISRMRVWYRIRFRFITLFLIPFLTNARGYHAITWNSQVVYMYPWNTNDLLQSFAHRSCETEV